MPHGDLSDLVGLSSLIFGLASIFYPSLWAMPVLAVQPLLTGPLTPSTLVAIQASGGGFAFMGLACYVVRWNRVNSAAAAVGCFIVLANSISIALAMDKNLFVFRGWYVIAVIAAIGVYHFIVNPNPVLTSAMLLQQEKDKEAKKAK